MNGKRYYPPMYIILPVIKGPRGLLPVNSGIIKKAELIIVPPAAILYSTAMASSTAIAGGQVFLSPSVKKALFMPRIIPMV